MSKREIEEGDIVQIAEEIHESYAGCLAEVLNKCTWADNIKYDVYRLQVSNGETGCFSEYKLELVEKSDSSEEETMNNEKKGFEFECGHVVEVVRGTKEGFQGEVFKRDFRQDADNNYYVRDPECMEFDFFETNLEKVTKPDIQIGNTVVVSDHCNYFAGENAIVTDRNDKSVWVRPQGVRHAEKISLHYVEQSSKMAVEVEMMTSHPKDEDSLLYVSENLQPIHPHTARIISTYEQKEVEISFTKPADIRVLRELAAIAYANCEDVNVRVFSESEGLIRTPNFEEKILENEYQKENVIIMFDVCDEYS